jgi:hypothetical protein
VLERLGVHHAAADLLADLVVDGAQLSRPGFDPLLEILVELTDPFLDRRRSDTSAAAASIVTEVTPMKPWRTSSEPGFAVGRFLSALATATTDITTTPVAASRGEKRKAAHRSGGRHRNLIE